MRNVGYTSCVPVRVVDELHFGFGWIHPEPAFMERCSHALADDGRRVWAIDPVDAPGVEDRMRALGEPVGVLQLLDRHGRDCAALAERLGVPLHVTPFAGVAGSPFRVLEIVRSKRWQEVALWWPERRVLVAADAVGTARYYRAGVEPLAVHPFLRPRPPAALRGREPKHVLCGHGAGVHGTEAAPALARALASSRRRLPLWVASAAYSAVTSRR